MKRVEFINHEVFLAGTTKKVGEIQPSRDECIDLILSNGHHVYVYYGTIYEDGEFHQFCRNTLRCGNCKSVNSPNCRYNRKNTLNAGYYADVDATQSVW